MSVALETLKGRAHDAVLILATTIGREMTAEERSELRDVIHELLLALPSGSFSCVMCSGTGICYRCGEGQNVDRR